MVPHKPKLFLFAALLGGCAAGGTVCSEDPSICDGTYNRTALDLRDTGLSGSLPTQLGKLTMLEKMYLPENKLSGYLPSQLGRLTALTDLSSWGNSLSGSLPTQLGLLTALQTILGLGTNELSGTLPTQLAALTNLFNMYLYSNSFSGSLPTEFVALAKLDTMKLQDNVMSGNLPQLERLTALESCDLGGTNKFSCPLPNSTCSKDLTCFVPPPPPSPSSPPTLPSSPIATGSTPEDKSIQALWALLPVCVLLVAALVLLCRNRSRLSRERANAIISRDRANVDLQMITHQVQKVQTQAGDSSLSLPDNAEFARRPESLSGGQAASLPPGPPSSAGWSAEEVGPRAHPSWAEADRLGIAASPLGVGGDLEELSGLSELLEQAQAFDMAEMLGLEEVPGKAAGVERSGVVPTAAPTLSMPQASSGLELDDLHVAELASLAELGDEEACLVMESFMHLPRGTPDQPPTQTAIEVIPSSSSLEEKFATLVMCNFTPRSPSELPLAQWASYKELLRLFKPHAPSEARQLGPGNLKQLITAWYKHHPAFAGLEVSKWCKKLTDHDPLVPARSQVFKFSFENTPGGLPLAGQAASRKRGCQSVVC